MKLQFRMLKNGFTLVEMAVVMAILAVLTFVALRSTTGIADRTRHEQTRRILSEVEEAIIGKQGAGANDSIPYSYISDMGAPPSAQPAPAELMDLWLMPAGAIANQIITDPIDPNVRLSSGWRGPYLQLPPGSLHLNDGFGNILKTTFPSMVTPEFSFTSLGSDGLAGGVDYASDFNPIVIIDAKPETDPTKINKTWAQVTGTLRVLTAPGPTLADWRIVVIAYQPNGTANFNIIEQDGGAQSFASGAAAPFTFTFSFISQSDPVKRLTPGARAIRAYLYKDAELPNFANDPRRTSMDGPDGKQSAGVSYHLFRYGSNILTASQELVIP